MTPVIHGTADLYSSQRLVGLAAHRSGNVVATAQSLDPDGAEWRTSLHLVDAPDVATSRLPVALTEPSSDAKILDLDDEGNLYVTLDREIEGADAEVEKGVWLLPPRGEARLLFTRAGGVESVAARGRRLVITADRLPVPTEEDHERLSSERHRKKVSGILHDSFPTRSWNRDVGPGGPALYVAEAPDYRLRRVDVPEGRLRGVEVSQDGRRAVVTMRRTRRGIHQRESVWLIDLDGVEDPRVLAEPAAPDSADREAERTGHVAGTFSPSGRRVLMESERNSMPGLVALPWVSVHDLQTRETHDLAPGLDRWIDDPVWIDDDRIAFVTDDRGRTVVWLTEIGSPDARRLTDDDFHYANLSWTGDALVATRDAVNRSADVVRLRLPEGGGLAEITEIPSPVPVVRGEGRLTEIQTTAEDGTALRAWLALPEGPGPHPLLTFVHGGPWGSWNAWSYRWNPWPFVANGYAVLLPDPALSTGYGQEMMQRGTDRLGGEPFTDILALIAEAGGRDDIDPDRTALLGGSYGGYMANWMAGQTGTKFRCIVTHASLWNLETMAGTTDNGAWQEWNFDSPDGAGNEYSPHRFVRDIQVPMLVIHGDKDYRVPISQAHLVWAELLRASPDLGHRYLYFPDEGHWIEKPENSRLWYQTVLAFLDHHVLGEPWKRPELAG